MKKQFTVGRVICYALYLSLAVIFILGVSYSRYTSEIKGNILGSVANMRINSTLDLTDKIKGIQPGKTVSIPFEITNKENANVSEVGQNYSITITTTNNLPLTLTIEAVSPGNIEGKAVGLSSSGEGKWIWNGGVLPYSAKGVTHQYNLTVSYSDNDSQYADEIDAMTMEIEATQMDSNGN